MYRNGIFGFTLLLLFGCTVVMGGDKKYEQPEYIWKCGHILAQTHPYQLGFEHLGRLLDERTGGRIRLDVFPSSQIGSERDLAEGIQMGTVDLALVSGPMANFDPNFYINDLPNLFTGRAHAYKVLDGEIGKGMMDGLSKVGIKGLAFWETGFLCMFNNKKLIKTPADLVGLNLRTMENITYINYFTALGCNPVPMAYGEYFTSVQNGTVNGTLSPIVTIYTDKTYQAAPYITDSRQWYCPTPLIMSLQLWNSLEPSLQGMIQQAAFEARDYMRKLLADREADCIREMEAAGATVTQVDQALWQSQKAAIDAAWAPVVPSKISQKLIDSIRALAE
jgi:tripartite ATP-independent transporter DctP family solute receptor